MVRKITIQDACELAIQRNGSCLSITCAGYKDTLKWQCELNHIWKTTYGTINNGSWCPICADTKKRLPLIQLQKLAQKKDGYCLATNYKNNCTPIPWRCNKNHTWLAMVTNIKQGKWCPYCAGNARLSIEQMHKIAEIRGGKCLSIEYINNNIKLLWQCAHNHIWEGRANDIIQKYKWCPICACSVGEQTCRVILENTYNTPFEKCRPNWLKNINNHNIELDGFSEKLKIAFEYNGLQHEKIVFSFHSEKDLKKIQEHDSIKIQKCAEVGIKLIIINEPRPFNINKIKEQIQKQIDVPINIENYKIENLVFAKTPLNKYQTIAEQKGGKCLSKTYINSQIKLEWQCQNNHTWWASPNAIQQGRWCRQCNGHSLLTTLKECQNVAAQHNGKCFSDSYKTQHTKMNWQCEQGHIWQAMFTSIKHLKTWCPICRTSKTISKNNQGS